MPTTVMSDLLSGAGHRQPDTGEVETPERLRSYKLCALALSSAKRIVAMPGGPTLAETSFEEFEVLE
jgi:hypothetical protein